MASFWYASSILNLRTVHVVNSGDNTRIYVLVYGEKINLDHVVLKNRM